MTDGEPRREPPLSPCILVCVMDGERRYCTGCRRTLDEIAGWWSYSDEQKREILELLPGRRR
jgi:predicted Fe-S protein YdhL (DUF1289 family)